MNIILSPKKIFSVMETVIKKSNLYLQPNSRLYSQDI